MAKRKPKTFAEQVARNLVLVKELRAKQEAMHEAMVAMFAGLEWTIHEGFGRVHARLDALISFLESERDQRNAPEGGSATSSEPGRARA